MSAPIKYDDLHDEEWLRERYMEERRSVRSISREVGCARQNVCHALDKFGLRDEREREDYALA